MIDFKEHKIMTPIGLTLDNLVYNRHGEVHALRIMDFHAWDHPLMNHDYGFYGIPLTSEWLENAGFTRKDNFAYDFSKLSIVLQGDYGYKDGRTYYNSWAILESQPKYVHSLQNLLHAIEGIELTIK